MKEWKKEKSSSKGRGDDLVPAGVLQHWLSESSRVSRNEVAQNFFDRRHAGLGGKLGLLARCNASSSFERKKRYCVVGKEVKRRAKDQTCRYQSSRKRHLQPFYSSI